MALTLQRLGLRGARTPDEKPVLDLRYDKVENEREHGQYEDAREHGVDVENTLGLVDEVAHAPRRAQILADHRAYKGEADRSMQTGEHPTRRRRQIDEAQKLLARRA